MSIIIGICNICGTTPIFDKRGNAWVPNDNYAEIYLHFSNDTIGRHGVCKGCLQSVTEEKIKTLMEKLRSYEFNALVGVGTKKQFDEISKREVVAWDDQRDRCISKYKKEKEKRLKDRLEKVRKDQEKKEKHGS